MSQVIKGAVGRIGICSSERCGPHSLAPARSCAGCPSPLLRSAHYTLLVPPDPGVGSLPPRATDLARSADDAFCAPHPAPTSFLCCLQKPETAAQQHLEKAQEHAGEAGSQAKVRWTVGDGLLWMAQAQAATMQQQQQHNSSCRSL